MFEKKNVFHFAFWGIYTNSNDLKERSRPSVSNVTSADVRLATTVARDQFCDVIGSRHEFHLKPRTDLAPKLFNERDETDPLKVMNDMP